MYKRQHFTVTLPEPPTPQRAAKMRARQRILASSLGTDLSLHHRQLQTDGPLSLPPSYENTPNTSPDHFRKLSSTDAGLLDDISSRASFSTTSNWDYSDLTLYPEDVFEDDVSVASLNYSFITGSMDNYSLPIQSTYMQQFSASLPNLTEEGFSNYTRVYPEGRIHLKREDVNHLMYSPFQDTP